MKSSKQDSSALNRIRNITFLGFALLTITMFLPLTSHAQRMCENGTYAVARISPCTGPTGTIIGVTLQRTLTSPAALIVFKRVLVNGVPAAVTVRIAGPTIASPVQLCTAGGGRWEVWLVNAAGVSQGVIGAFWPDCSGSTGPTSGPILTPVRQPAPTIRIDPCLVWHMGKRFGCKRRNERRPGRTHYHQRRRNSDRRLLGHAAARFRQSRVLLSRGVFGCVNNRKSRREEPGNRQRHP